MLSSRERLATRQGKSGTPRHEYLQQLVSEYARSQHWLRKEEIVANLANFAYDPINYAALKRLQVMELFVEIISTYRDDNEKQYHSQIEGCSTLQHTRDAHFERRQRDESASVTRSKRLLVEFAMGGICNCIPDPSLQISFIESDGVAVVLERVASITMDVGSDATASEEPSEQERRQREAKKSAFNTALSALTIVYFLLDSPAFASVSSEDMMGHIQRLCDHPSSRIANVAKAYVSRYNELVASVAASPGHEERLTPP